MSMVPAICVACVVAWSSAAAAETRRVLDLNGCWEIAEGTMEKVPAQFRSRVPVPGLADMAQPPFQGVGVREDRDTLREAFWYRRTFVVPGPAPAAAMLKVHKAMYGTRVYLNGRLVGEHLPSFTPGYFDLKPQLRFGGAENELIIRVGAARGAIPGRYMDGNDFEKIRYVPGIYDNVELLLSGTPRIVRIQTVPEPDRQSVRVQAVIAGPGKEGRVRFSVREAGGEKVTAKITVKHGALTGTAERTLDVRIPLPGASLWTPEVPFLYELEAVTRGDSMRVCFGMRSFGFDAERGVALLNGRPYYLRGTNICIFRFFEDPERGGLPWNEEWARRVIRAFKSMHWNAARYCIGFPPELWYRIADEEGLLIQDEAPIWLGRDMKQREAMTVSSLSEEFTEWVQERWNHPSVVIWDAQNESELWPLTGQVIRNVRELDLSHRPWDNGWSPRQAESDPVESHTYYFQEKRFRIPSLARETGEGTLLDSVPGSRRGAVILNEYGWFWIDRTGAPTTLAVSHRSFERIRPDITTWTPALYREAYAKTLAVLTEFFRGHRKMAGVMHFCGLGYSRPGGQTSDNFLDLDAAVLEPNFKRYVGDAFAPVGLMMDFWADRLEAGSTQTVPVRVLNDLDRPWKGDLRLSLMEGRAVVNRQSHRLSVPPLGDRSASFEFTVPSAKRRYRLVAEIKGDNGKTVRSEREFAGGSVIEKRRSLKPVAVTASSSDGPLRAGYAADGDEHTRWSSKFSDPQWITLDLGRPARINEVMLDWEDAYGKEYSIEVSEDAQQWQEVHRTDQGKGAVEKIVFRQPVTAHYVRLYGYRRGTPWGYSLYSFEVYPADQPDDPRR